MKSKSHVTRVKDSELCEAPSKCQASAGPPLALALALTCQLTFARDQCLPQGFLQRAMPMQEHVAGSDRDMGSAIDGLRGGRVGSQLFSRDLPVNLVGERQRRFTLQPSFWAAVLPSDTPFFLPPSTPYGGDSSCCRGPRRPQAGVGGAPRRAGPEGGRSTLRKRPCSRVRNNFQCQTVSVLRKGLSFPRGCKGQYKAGQHLLFRKTHHQG